MYFKTLSKASFIRFLIPTKTPFSKNKNPVLKDGVFKKTERNDYSHSIVAGGFPEMS